MATPIGGDDEQVRGELDGDGSARETDDGPVSGGGMGARLRARLRLQEERRAGERRLQRRSPLENVERRVG